MDLPTNRPAGHRYPPLDGLRGIAILGVLFFHAFLGLDWTTPLGRAIAAGPSLGWMGVDIFFVISGFLITGILLDTRNDPKRFRNFYARRFLRIVPVYYLLLAIVFLILPLIVPFDTEGLRTIRNRQAWLWIYLTNLSFVYYGKVWTQSGWLDLNHLWSLAVEEQFYFLWPCAVFFLNRQSVKRICLACIFVSLALRIVLWQTGQRNGAIYFPTPCRLDGLAMGSLVALLIRESVGVEALVRPARRVGAIAFAALASLALARGGLVFTDKPTSVIAIAVVSLLAACVVILIVDPNPGNPLAAVMDNAFLRATGKYSYAIYLFHGVLFTPLTLLLPPRRLIAATGSETAGNLIFVAIFVALSYALALISWHTYEKHWLQLKSRFGSRTHSQTPLP